LNGIQSVRVNAKKDGNLERRTAKNGLLYFVLTANKREVIGVSEMYSSARSMEKGLASVKVNARSAALKDVAVKK
jgi:uncharacterized protein YegP (UPF0339 family)